MTPSTNVNKVPMKQWRRWSPRAKHTFNTTYDFLASNQALACHPKVDPQSPAHWKTLSWNAAWIAADAVDELLPVIDEIVDISPRTGKAVRTYTVKSALPASVRGERRAT